MLKESAFLANSARLSVMLDFLSRHTGMPPSFLHIGPSGQKNHSFFMRKPLDMFSALEKSRPIRKSMLLVWGAKQMIYFFGCATVMLVFHPIRRYSNHAQIFFNIICCLLAVISYFVFSAYRTAATAVVSHCREALFSRTLVLRSLYCYLHFFFSALNLSPSA